MLDVAAAGLFLVYVERRDTASASPSSSVPSPCPTPLETLDTVTSPTPAVTLQISPAVTPSTTPSGSLSFDPGVLEDGDHFGEGEPSASPGASPSGSARPSGSPSPSPSVAERGPTSPDRLAAHVASPTPLPSAAPLPSSGAGESPSPAAPAFPSPSSLPTPASSTPLSTPTLTSPTLLSTIPISPTPVECPSPLPSLLVASPSPSPLPTVTTSPSPSASAPAHADTPYENATLGYTLSYPGSWILRVNGSLTELLNPSRQALVSFGRGPAGSLSKASDAYFTSLRQRYDDFDPSFTEVEIISGAVARVMVGRATNENGKRLRFRVILIHGEDENLAIASFAALDVSSSVQAALDEIIGSLGLPAG